LLRNKAESMLGLAAKAGRAASGEFMAERTIRAGQACLTVLATDSSENTKKKFRNMCAHYKVPLYFCSDKTDLGHAIGKGERSVVVVTDPGLAQAVERHLQDSKEHDGGSEYGK